MTWIVRALRQLAVVVLLPLVIGMSLSTRCEADWVSNYPGGMPFDAIVGAWIDDAVPSYFCRAYYVGSVQPGWAAEGGAECHFSYGGLELTSSNFDWYVPSWTYSYGQPMPVNAIPFGAEPVNGVGAYRYPCRVNLTPGKYGQDFNACYFPYGGEEHHQPTSGFSWLVDPGNHVSAPPPDSNLTFNLEDDVYLGPYLTAYVQDSGSPSGTVIPPDAVVAGLDSDGTPLYFCSAFFETGPQPGKARRDWNACDVSWGGSEHYVDSHTGFVVLTPAWVVKGPICGPSGAECNPTANLMPVGTDSDGSTLYACQGNSGAAGDGEHLGKTKAAWNGVCSYAYNGIEIWALPIHGVFALTDGFNFPAPQPWVQLGRAARASQN